MELDDLHDPDFTAWIDARRDEAIAHQDAAQRALDAQHRAQRCALAAPHPQQWEPAYAALRDEARALVGALNAALETGGADVR